MLFNIAKKHQEYILQTSMPVFDVVGVSVNKRLNRVKSYVLVNHPVYETFQRAAGRSVIARHFFLL